MDGGTGEDMPVDLPAVPVSCHTEQAVLCPRCTSGTWLVVTASGGGYVLDLDAGTARRTPRPELADDRLADPALALRADGTEVVVVDLTPVVVGRPMLLLLHGVAEDPAFATVRMTSPVTSAEPLRAVAATTP